MSLILLVLLFLYFTCEKETRKFILHAIQAGLVEAGFAKMETEKIR